MKDLGITYHPQSCHTCRYFRVWISSHAVDSECLLRGRTLGIASTSPGMTGDTVLVEGWARERVCALWKRRPKTWRPYVHKNPHFFDPYVKRGTMRSLRWKLLGIRSPITPADVKP